MEPLKIDGLSSAALPLTATEEGRQRLVRTALRITENTPLAPGDYERMLLDQFVLGQLTIDQVLAQLDAQELV